MRRPHHKDEVLGGSSLMVFYYAGYHILHPS